MSMSYAPHTIKPPEGLEELLWSFAEEVLREQPEDIPSFGAKYFRSAHNERRNPSTPLPPQPVTIIRDFHPQEATKGPEHATVQIFPSAPPQSDLQEPSQEMQDKINQDSHSTTNYGQLQPVQEQLAVQLNVTEENEVNIQASAPITHGNEENSQENQTDEDEEKQPKIEADRTDDQRASDNDNDDGKQDVSEKSIQHDTEQARSAVVRDENDEAETDSVAQYDSPSNITTGNSAIMNEDVIQNADDAHQNEDINANLSKDEEHQQQNELQEGNFERNAEQMSEQKVTNQQSEQEQLEEATKNDDTKQPEQEQLDDATKNDDTTQFTGDNSMDAVQVVQEHPISDNQDNGIDDETNEPFTSTASNQGQDVGPQESEGSTSTLDKPSSINITQPELISNIAVSDTDALLKHINIDESINKAMLLLQDASAVQDMWQHADQYNSGIMSLSDLTTFLTEKGWGLKWPALLYAYKKTTLKDGDEDAWVEKNEFPAFLQNAVFFDRLWDIFDDIDTGDDRRISMEEFSKAMEKLGSPLQTNQVLTEFSRIDRNGGGFILFKEFCDYIASLVGVKLGANDSLTLDD